jgi:hypothetical protein
MTQYCGVFDEPLLLWKRNNAFYVYCWATCHWQYKNIEYCTKLFLWRRCVAGKNKTYLSLHVECRIFLSDFNRFMSFSTDFHRRPIPNFMKICPEETVLIRTDRRMNMTQLRGAFWSYVNARKKSANKRDFISVPTEHEIRMLAFLTHCAQFSYSL